MIGSILSDYSAQLRQLVVVPHNDRCGTNLPKLHVDKALRLSYPSRVWCLSYRFREPLPVLTFLTGVSTPANHSLRSFLVLEASTTYVSRSINPENAGTKHQVILRPGSTIFPFV